MKTPLNIPITGASVRVMRSFDYNHFEVALSSACACTPEDVDELRKAAQRLADHAVEQFQTAKAAAALKSGIESEWALKQAQQTPEGGRTPEQLAVLKYHSDAAFAARFDYDYEDDWSQPDWDHIDG